MIENKETGSLPGNVGDINSGNVTDEMVSRSSYVKLMDQRKSDQRKMVDLQEKLDSYSIKIEGIENQKLAAEGKKDELIGNYQTKITDLESKFKQTVDSFGRSTLNRAIKNLAVEKDCVDPSKLLKLIDPEDYNSLANQIDSNFEVDQDSLQALVNKAIDENANIGLFGKKVVNDKNIPINNKMAVDSKDESEMSHTDIINDYKRRNGL